MGSRRYALAEIAEINSAQYSPKEKWPLIQYLDTGSVTRGHIDALQQLIPGTDKIPGRARRKVKDGSIVYSMVRPNQEHYALLSNPPANMLASTGFAVIDAKTDVVTPEYLYYALIHPDTTTHFQALAEQVVSTYPTLGRDDLARFEIDVPSLEEQRAIAALLTSFDEKVALNQQTNDYLAGLLDLAYQRFFGPGAKRKVTMRALNEVCDTISVKHAFNKDQLIFLNTGDIEKGLFLHSDYSEVAGMPGQAKKSIRRNDILYSEIRPVNRHYAFVNFDADDYVVSTKLMVLRAKGVHPRRVYQFLTLKDTVSQLQLEAESRSGTFPQIRFENLTHFEIPLLSDSEEDEYLRIILPIYDLIDANNQESFALAALRNTLLPKLMSGEIDVSQIELLTPPNNHLSCCRASPNRMFPLLPTKGSAMETAINLVLAQMQPILSCDQLKQLGEVLRFALSPRQDASADLLRLFLTAKEVEGCSARTITYYESTIQHMVEAVGKPYTQIESDDLRGYLAEYETKRKAGKVTIDNIRRILSSFFSWLEDEDYIVKSPVRRIHRVKTATVTKEVLSDEDLETLRDNCVNARDLAIVDMLATTGMRVGELVGLNIADIDLQERECIVTGKGNKQRPVYFDARAKLHLQAYLDSRTDDCPALFVSLDATAERLSIGGVETRLRNLGAACGVSRVHPHKFRRTLATHAIDKGMPVEQVQKLLGHARIDTTMHYAMVNQNNVKASHRKYLE